MSSLPKNTKTALFAGSVAAIALAVGAIYAAGPAPVTTAVSAPTQTEAPTPDLPIPQSAGLPSTVPEGALPFPVEIDVAFSLTDQNGNRVSERDFRGRPILLFFGYTYCESICNVALPRMGEALDSLGPDGENISAVMITIDPARDTPKALRENLPRWHDRLEGLTGTPEELSAVRERFNVNLETVAHDPTGAPIYAHGSFVYLIDAEGGLATMIPPILGPERIAELARKYF